MRKPRAWMIATAFLVSGPSLAADCTDPLAAAASLAGETLDLAALHGFYRQGDGCLWNDGTAASLRAALAMLTEDGLDPEQFHGSALAGPDDGAHAAERDLLLTDAALAYARAMSTGRVDPVTLPDQIDFPHREVDAAPALRAALDRGEVVAWLAALPPDEPQYAALKQALARYRGFTPWDAIPATSTAIEPGQRSPLIPQLKRRLAAEAELLAVDAGDALDGTVLEALKHFQRRHGLTADGRLGKQSLAVLNVPLSERIDQITANLERWREVARLLPPTRVEVNVAAALVTILRDGEAVSQMRAVVGDATHQTPMLISSIRDVEINPPWIVPASIIRKEIMPRQRRDPTYLEREAMTWRDGQLVQSPGARNALGRLKFEFSNPFSIYLHDTPMHKLFALDFRLLSHGCVRLEHPLDLAQTLLDEASADPIQQAIAGGGTSRMRLPAAMPVAVLYWSVYVEADGTVAFRDDLYRRDARLAAALHAPRHGPAGTGTLL
ncbi:MAG: L,D-transpeptidase family protein [Aliidongia sp.]